MGALFLDMFLVALAAAIGGGTGWFLRGDGPLEAESDPATDAALRRALSDNEGLREELHVHADENVGLKQELSDAQMEALHARDALTGLHQIAAGMTANVDEHTRNVQAINEDLEEDGGASDIVACVEQLFTANSKMQSQLAEAEQEIEAKQAEIVSHLQEARTDSLTTLANRRALDLEMERCEEEFKSSNSPACVMVFDVDHFKKFNDTYGHQAGDEVLRGVARVLTDNVTGEHMVCRYGGEEFCIIFSGCDLQSAIPIAEKARSAIADASFHHEGQELRVKASGGLAQFMEGETHEELVKRADDALYLCKESGRDCGHWHDGNEMHRMALPPTQEEQTSDEPDEQLEADDQLEPEEQSEPAIDPLTQLGTKEPFIDDLNRHASSLRRGGEELTAVLLRVDGFAAVTEGFGAPSADRVLRTTAQFMESAMRESDHVARFDVDRFAMILPNTSCDDALTIAERIRELAELSKLPTDSGLLQFTVSLSVTGGELGDTAESITGRLEEGIKMAIDGGGNQFHLVQPTTAS